MACRMANAGSRVAEPLCSTSIILWKATLAHLCSHVLVHVLKGQDKGQKHGCKLTSRGVQSRGGEEGGEGGEGGEGLQT